MAIVTISRGCFSHGKDIAQKAAELLDYGCVSREILIDASRHFDVSEKKLLTALHDAPGMLDKFTHGTDEYLCYAKAALAENVRKDNVVYHGYGGHLLLPDIAHVLKIRIISDFDTRVAYTMEKEGLSYGEATRRIRKEDEHRKIWTRTVFGKNLEDPFLYDAVLNIGDMGIDDAAGVIADLARSESFKTTPESRKSLDDYAIRCHAAASLYRLQISNAQVRVNDAAVMVYVPPRRIRKTAHMTPKIEQDFVENEKKAVNRSIKEELKKIPGVNEVYCSFDEPFVH
ncbi:MAG: cytidylate kinase-like family protein [Desulfarculaceae bacterium]|nr:cytidylate kinase-like family protein [Desulfarculaceae bacterium]